MATAASSETGNHNSKKGTTQHDSPVLIPSTGSECLNGGILSHKSISQNTQNTIESQVSVASGSHVPQASLSIGLALFLIGLS